MKPDWLDKSTILKCEVGSGAHGIAQAGTDDHDEMGVCLEPYPLAFGTGAPFEQYVYRTAAERDGRHDAPSQPGDTDLTVYSLRKWVRLALKGNPTVLLLLFSTTNVVGDARGFMLRERADWFASRAAAGPFLGYLHAQRQRLVGERGQRNVNRRDLVERFGYDTKYAGHMVRLGIQGCEFLRTGRLTLPMADADRRDVLAIRRGEVPLNDVLTRCGELERELADLAMSSPLQGKPDVAAAEDWMLRIYLEHWKATWEWHGLLTGRF